MIKARFAVKNLHILCMDTALFLYLEMKKFLSIDIFNF